MLSGQRIQHSVIIRFRGIVNNFNFVQLVKNFFQSGFILNFILCKVFPKLRQKNQRDEGNEEFAVGGLILAASDSVKIYFVFKIIKTFFNAVSVCVNL